MGRIKSKISFYIKEFGDTIDDAVFFRDVIINPDDAYAYQDIASEVAEYIWRHQEGHEWMSDNTILTIVAEGEEIGDFALYIENEVSIYARKIKSEK